MRLALIAHHVAPIRAPFCGGVESFTWYLARWMARRGHDVVLYGPPGSRIPGVELRELELAPRLSEESRCDVDMPPEAFMGAHHAYQRVMLDLGMDPDGFDLVHSNTLHYLPLLMSPTLDVPMLTTLHTPPTPWLESAMRSVVVHDTPSLSAVSPTTRDAWAGIAPALRVVQNGVDTDAWAAGPGGDEAVWCGRIVPEKAPHLAIDACRAAGRPLRIAGPVIDHAYWHAEVEPRLGPDAVYVGHLDHDALRSLIGHSAVALMTPTWDEPFGLAAAEAMACGTPVAAFARGGLPELVGREGGRMALPEDVADLTRAVREAAAMDRAAVRAHVVRTAGIDRMGQGYERLYERLIRRHAPSAVTDAPSSPRRARTARSRRVLEPRLTAS